MILGFLLLACCLTSVMAAAGDKQSPEPKKKVNFFNADNGLGAVAAADLGLYLGAVAFHENGPWQGFPESAGNGDIAAALSAPSDCAESNGGAIAKALLNNPASPPPPPEGVIRTASAALPASEDRYDMKSIYQAGQAFNCPSPQH